ncbi:MAG: SDR family NAD(P)-dependent oxidoreductase, partial [Solirubrobacterales bacterium]|nr:SDR family NAD(P)-dependent oxidoreductase [Solirubrobacterales bacterium]
MEPRGQTVLLTGATGGLGRAIAAALAGRGATLVLSSRKADQLTELAAALAGEGHRSVVADLAEPGSAERLAADAGRVDILVANAGLPAAGRLEGFAPNDIERALRVNLEAPIQLARALIEPMRERGRGHLVFVSSLSGKAATARQSLYSATKFGLRGFALALRQDLWDTPVGVSVVSPGFVREAGMFADSGAKPPPGLGTTSPRRVAAAVVEAIERDRGEIAAS